MTHRLTTALLGIALLAGCLDSSSDSPDGVWTPTPIAPTGELEVTPSVLDFGDVLVGDSRTLKVSVRNRSSFQQEITAVELISSPGTDFAIVSGPESVSIAPDATVEYEVVYAPQEPTTQSATLELKTSNRDNPNRNFPVKGKGTPVPVPEIDLSALALGFGQVQLGSSGSLEVSVRNIGTAPLTVARVALAAGTPACFSVSPRDWTGSIEPSASQTFAVSFVPVETGESRGTLEIESDDADEALLAVALSGSGAPIPAPEIDVAPLALHFGEVMVGSTSSLAFTIRNVGTSGLALSRVALGSGTTTAFAVVEAPSGTTLAPGASVSMSVTYTPVDAVSDSRTVRVESNDDDEPEVVVSLSGTGIPVPVPDVDVTPTSLAFGDVMVGSAKDLTVAVRNTGSASLAVTSIALAPGASPEFAIVSGAASGLIAPSSSLTVRVRYAPADTSADSATLRIASDDPDEPMVAVSLSGRGTPVPVPEVTVSPVSLAFGDLVVGQSATLSFTVRNDGTASLAVSRIALGAGTSSAFAIVSGPASVDLAPGASAGVSVAYRPTAAVSSTGTVVVESNDADEAVVAVSLSGRGVPAPLPEIDVTPLSLSFGDVVVGGSFTLSVTVRNVGTADLSVSSIGIAVGSSPAFLRTAGPSSATVAPGQSVVASVTYTPPGEGVDQGSLVIASNDADEAQVVVGLTGRGVAPAPTTGSVTLFWDAPTTNADGTPCTDLAGYKLYYGSGSRQYSMVLDLGNVTTHALDGLASGTYYFAVSAYDSAGNESELSTEAFTTLQ